MNNVMRTINLDVSRTYFDAINVRLDAWWAQRLHKQNLSPLTKMLTPIAGNA